jgi:hypothetical protein
MDEKRTEWQRAEDIYNKYVILPSGMDIAKQQIMDAICEAQEGRKALKEIVQVSQAAIAHLTARLEKAASEKADWKISCEIEQREKRELQALVKRLGEAGFNTIRHKNGYNKFSNFLRPNDKDGERQCWVNWELVTGELLSVLNDIPEYKAALAEGREETK